MKLKEFVRQIRRDVEAFGYALDHDERDEIRSRVARLERFAGDAKKRG